jgi:hypothetical protein
MSLLDPTLKELRAADGWAGLSPQYPPGPDGLLYRCAFCDKQYPAVSSAQKHERATGHTVLRVDWDHPDYWEHVKRLRLEAHGG